MRLLLEFGVEELPAIPFLREKDNILIKWEAALDTFGASGEFCFEYTPRRLVIFGDLPEFAPDKEVENIGAPKQVALKDGVWSKAAESFAKKCGISTDELKFKDIDGKEVLYHRSVLKGLNARQIVPQAALNFIKSLNFGRSMRWGSGEFEFIRPLRSIVCTLDDENLDVEIFGIKSQKAFYPHRDFGYDKIEFAKSADYFKLLAANGVILKASERRAKILSEFAKIEAMSGLKIEIDENLLDEVVTITESPVALLGEFEADFLEVPSEVIVTSMKENQRYFALRDASGALSNHFVVISNSTAHEQNLIIKGNEKVLRARLSDAKFFWDSDLKTEFSAMKLKNVTYLSELGSMYDKELRERDIAGILAGIYHKELMLEFGDGYIDEIERAVMLSKADLTTSMVYEFTDLQGIVGSYYAKARGENHFVCDAIYEQYLPSGDSSACPKTLFSSIVALSSKLDTLMGLFSIGKIPSGNKDPYALRRAALGVIKIALNLGVNFDVKAVLERIKGNYKEFDLNILTDFIFDRLYTLYDVNSSIIKACINSGESDIRRLNSAIIALGEISSEMSFKDNFATFKRLANIIKDAKIGKVDESLFENESERALHARFKALRLDLDDVKMYLSSLFDLKGEIDAFFDAVMINHENPKIKENRIALIGQIYEAFLKIADIKEISA